MAETLRVNRDHLKASPLPPLIATLRDNQARFGTAGERKTLSILLADFLSFPLAMADCPVQPVCVIFCTTPFLQAFIFANALSFSLVFSASRWLLVYTVRTPSSAYESVCAAPHALHGSGAVEMDGAMDGWRDGWVDGQIVREADVCVPRCDGRSLPSTLTLITYLASHRPTVRDTTMFLIPAVMWVRQRFYTLSTIKVIFGR